jgi:hypothetical protein
VIPWFKGTVDIRWLSDIYVAFFKGEPWNEYLICPVCKPDYDFGPGFTWGDKDAPVDCPTCGSELAFFWSPERLEKYIFGDRRNEGFVVLCDGEVAAWQMGRAMNQEQFYVDIIAILPKYRRNPGIEAFLCIFRQFVATKKQEGYRQIVSRTHRKANRVRLLFGWLGFTEAEVSEDDPDRTYWILNC